MSRGTTFRLLKVAGEKLPDEKLNQLTKAYEEKYEKDRDCVEDVAADPSTPRHPKFVDTEKENFDVVDATTGIPYNVSMEFTFNSTFSEVRSLLEDEYGLNSYVSWKSQHVVSKEDAREMLIAANYILLEHYDEKIEEVLDNPYIEPIGLMSAAHSNYKYRLKFPDDTEYYPDEDYSDNIRHLRTILSALLEVDDSEQYVLVVEVWG